MINLLGLGKTLLPVLVGGLGGVLKFIKSAWDGLTKEPAQAVAVMDALNDASSASDINRITEAFEDYKDRIRGETVKINKAACEEVEYFLEELNGLLQENQGILERYQIRTRYIERRIPRILSQVDGNLERQISRAVSLDNPACKKVLEMVPGTRKEEAMAAFFESVLKSALEQLCRDIRDMLGEVLEELEEELPRAVERSQTEMRQWNEEMGRMEQDSSREEAERIMEMAACVAAACDLAEEVMGG